MSDDRLRTSLHDAISLFNRANTDASEVPDSAELVMMRAAYETLMESGYKTEELKKKLTEHFSGDLIDPSWDAGVFSEDEWRTRWPKKSDADIAPRPFAIWVDDFCNARNSSAHGTNLKSKYGPSIWSIQNHLMFAAWLFPLIVKKILETDGVYSLNENERDCRVNLEDFFAHDISKPAEIGRLQWHLPFQQIEVAALARTLENSYSQHQVGKLPIDPA